MSNLTNLLQKIIRHLKSLFISLFTKKDNPYEFKQNYEEVLSTFSQNKNSYDYQKYVIANWKKYTDEIEDFFVNNFSFNFLRQPLLKSTMFAHLPPLATKIQKNLIKEIYGNKKAGEILKEHNLGNPILNDLEFTTSGNNIHHLYHIAKLQKETGSDISQMDSMVELGGGYGNFIKIIREIKPGITCTIIDIPVFSYIQLVYLRTIFGKDEVILFDPKQGIVENKINIVPFHEPHIKTLGKYFSGSPDLFVSTWALSESNEETQKLFNELEFFDSKNLLLAYQKSNDSFTHAEQIANLPSKYRTEYNAETEYLADNYYLFAKSSKNER